MVERTFSPPVANVRSLKMNHLSTRKSAISTLLLFLTAQIVLPVFCCCGISSVLGQTSHSEAEGKSCPRCVNQQSDETAIPAISSLDGAHECSCQVQTVKKTIRSTKATVQLDLPLHLDAVIHTTDSLTQVIDLHENGQGRTGPPDLIPRHSQSHQSMICCWLC